MTPVRILNLRQRSIPSAHQKRAQCCGDQKHRPGSRSVRRNAAQPAGYRNDFSRIFARDVGPSIGRWRQTEGKGEMTERLSLSIFTTEVDRKAIFAVQFRKHSDAEELFTDEALLDQLRMVRSAGAPLVDKFSILRVRLAREKERECYFENAASLLTSNGQLAVLLVKLDEIPI
jgi:hypothetical protein